MLTFRQLKEKIKLTEANKFHNYYHDILTGAGFKHSHDLDGTSYYKRNSGESFEKGSGSTLHTIGITGKNWHHESLSFGDDNTGFKKDPSGSDEKSLSRHLKRLGNKIDREE